jgi:transposase
MRAICLEYGITIGQGAGLFRRDLPAMLADGGTDLAPAVRRILGELFEDLGRLNRRIASATCEIHRLGAGDDRARRLMTIPASDRWPRRRALAAVGDVTCSPGTLSL